MNKALAALLVLALTGSASCKNFAKKNSYEKSRTEIVLEISSPDVITSLATDPYNASLQEAIALANEQYKQDGDDYAMLFYKVWKENNAPNELVKLFATYKLRDKLSASSSDDAVLEVLRQEIDKVSSNTFNVIRNRLDRFKGKALEVKRLNASQILVVLPDTVRNERLIKLLTSRGYLEFWETYSNITFGGEPSLFELLLHANKLIGEANESLPDDCKIEGSDASLFNILIPSNKNYQVPVVGIAHLKDTAKISKLLKLPAVSQLFPITARFLWTAKPKKEGMGDYYELVAIKTATKDGRAKLDGRAIVDAKVDNSQWGRYVDMTMSNEGARIWSQMTAENIGSSIAMVVDGKVYSYPTVQSEITGGKTQISGNFSREEAEDMAIILKSSDYPFPVHIVSEKVFN